MRSRERAPVEQQEHAKDSRRAQCVRGKDQPRLGGERTGGHGVFAPIEPENEGGMRPSRSRRAVLVHKRESEGLPETGRARHFGGRQEEGKRREFQERRQGIPPRRKGSRGERVRLHRQGEGKGGAVRGMRSRQEQGVGERWDKFRYRRIRRKQHPFVVVRNVKGSVSGRDGNLYKRGRGRKQRFPVPALEGKATRVGQRAFPYHPRIPLPPGNQQVEQDRAPHVLFHLPELAGASAHRQGNGSEPHRENFHENVIADTRETRRQGISERNKDFRRGIGGRRPRARRVPRGVEL